MNCFKFLYDVFVWITTHYSEMPESFRKSFPEDDCLNGRLFLSDVTQADSQLNIDFKKYE